MKGKCHFKTLAEKGDEDYIKLFTDLDFNTCRNKCSGYIGYHFGCEYHVTDNEELEKMISKKDMEVRGVRK